MIDDDKDHEERDTDPKTSGEAPTARRRPTKNVNTKPMINLGKRCQISDAFALSPPFANIDMVGPDIGKNKCPDSDENVDENLDRGSGAKQPAGLIN
jgi:hypothetical protein